MSDYAGPERRKVPRPNTPKIACPKCGHWQSAVKDGRPCQDGYKRKRVCGACAKTFFTIEKAA